MRNRIDNADIVYVPPGEFQMGHDDQPAKLLFQLGLRWKQDNPRHQVNLSGYYIYKDPVTVEQYENFCEKTGRPDALRYSLSSRSCPITEVTWDDAVAYAQWAGAGLPSEAQWEKAARGTDGRKYPWGNKWDASLCCNKKGRRAADLRYPLKNTSNMDDMISDLYVAMKYRREYENPGPVPVGSYPGGASPYGCLDMAGNVLEWCRDWADPLFWTRDASKVTDPVNESFGDETKHIVRGGSWCPFFVERRLYRTWSRDTCLRTGRHSNVGFRCVIGPNSDDLDAQP